MRIVVLFPAAVFISTIGAPAQTANMQEIAQGLGVKCEYCHAGMGRGAGPSAAEAPSQPPSRIEIGRAMIAMTREINEKILQATGKPATEATRVTCITCHRGVPIPGQLSDIIAKTTIKKGPDEAVAQYRDLRARYYGGQSYDFGEETLLASAQQVVRVKPASSIPLLQLNLEFYPKSVRSYAQIAFAYTRDLNDEAAITALEKALEIEPDNGQIRGQLEQLKSYRRRR
jgi:tetratricopeptide (TPR) repeat protein